MGRVALVAAGLLFLREAWLWWSGGRAFLDQLTTAAGSGVPELADGPPRLIELGAVIVLFLIGWIHLRRLAWSIQVTTTMLVTAASAVWLRLWWVFRDGFDEASVRRAAEMMSLEPGLDSLYKRFDLAVLLCLLTALSLLYAGALSGRSADGEASR